MPTFGRNIKDGALSVSTAPPAQNTNVNSVSIDLGAGDTFTELTEFVEFEVAVPNWTTLANAQTVTFTVQDSADNASFNAAGCAVPAILVSNVATGAGGIGTAAYKASFRLPAGTRRYVRVNAAASATAGALVGSFVFGPKF